MSGTPIFAPTSVLAPDWWTPALTLTERTTPADTRATAPDWVADTEAALALPLGGPEGGAVVPGRVPGAQAASHGAGGEAVARGSAAGTETVEPGARPEPDGFGAVVWPFVAHARRELAGRPAFGPGVDVQAVMDAFAARLGARLVRAASRTLVLELHRARKAGRLAGATPERRFDDFVRLHSTPSGLAHLLTEYPVLARLLACMSRQAVDAAAELLGRFAADRAQIVRRLLGGADPGPLTCLAESGDRHRDGRAVAVLHFASGARVVYKPRPIAMHGHFNDLVRWLGASVPGLGPRTVALIDRGEYGWAEFVHARPCDTAAGVDRFYYRQGALLALLYALGATDMHFDNVIACADQPVIIDAETLLHPALPAALGDAPDPAIAALTTSVMDTMLLPLPLVGDQGAADMSGLGGDHSDLFPVDVVSWDAPGTDEMRLVRRPAPFAGGANRPTHDGAAPDPTDHRDALLAGFRAAYDAIVAHRDDLLGLRGLLNRFADDEVRVLTRPTHVYASLLDESTHPDVLRDAVERDRVLDHLSSTAAVPVHRLTVGHELAELWNGDVPLFAARPGSRDLWTGTGEVVPGVLDTSALDAAARKIRGMGPADRDDQEWIIRASLATRRTTPIHECPASEGPAGEPVSEGPVSEGSAGEPVSEGPVSEGSAPEGSAPEGAVLDRDRLVAAARGVGDRILGRAYQDGGRTNWLGLEPAGDRRWTIMPLGAGLATGYTGTALFLAELADMTGIERYAATARRALEPLPGLLDALTGRPDHISAIGCGGFSGLGGVAYALARLAALLDDATLAACVEPAVDLAALAVDSDDELGVAEGSAGCLAAMLSVHELTGSPAARRTAMACADRLLEHPATATLPPGFAEGAAGVGWALLRFAASGADGRPAEHERLAAHERPAEHCRPAGHHRPAERDRFAEYGRELLVRAASSVPAASSWCRGAPGVALALAGTPAVLTDPAIAATIDRITAGIARGGPLADQSLCHGESGRLELLTVAARLGRPPAVAARLRQGNALLAALETSGPRCGDADVAGPGLLHGLAGIGYALLRLAAPDLVPSVPLLQAPDRRTDA
ncbi:type 2 lantipeptide synthetase LanM [Sphaerisporangium album]|uniref:Type 2 lantipeptide synthetase LanM n=1 Tax=Sphaerisporangium album TaxID=509200 RepID=A0A367EXQ7_9ACTN|nr:type 2 lanthipeptide synthetase LanM family protein [Sphaerisporangium album]RCG22422.1 type 2 lantipeptide synthetase LanM [Sphaerisporangium album]